MMRYIAYYMNPATVIYPVATLGTVCGSQTTSTVTGTEVSTKVYIVKIKKGTFNITCYVSYTLFGVFGLHLGTLKKNI